MQAYFHIMQGTFILVNPRQRETENILPRFDDWFRFRNTQKSTHILENFI